MIEADQILIFQHRLPVEPFLFYYLLYFTSTSLHNTIFVSQQHHNVLNHKIIAPSQGKLYICEYYIWKDSLINYNIWHTYIYYTYVLI